MRPLKLLLFTLLLSGSLTCGPSVDDTTIARLRTLDLTEAAMFADLERRQEAAPVRVDPERRTVFIPNGQKLNLFFRLAGESTLEIDQIRRTGASPYRLLLQRDGGQEVVVDEIDADSRDSRFELAGGDSDFVRLSFVGSNKPDREGGLLLVAPRILTAAIEPETKVDVAVGRAQPNIIIYLVDTLRKDHLGLYGHSVPVSPQLDAFADTATVYDRAIAQSTWTRPSVASVFTGLEPHLHGVNRRADALPHEVETLAEVLGPAGYETAAFITNGNVGREYQFDQGFEFFSRSLKLEHRANQLNERVFDYLDDGSRQGDHPLFLYIHAVDPHAPYEPPESFRERFAATVDDPKFGNIDYLNGYHKRQEIPADEVIDKALALYDAEIAYLDQEFGHFLIELQKRDLFDNSLIVFVSDHGEEFWEHGDWSHGQSLYGELLDMPLVIKDPGQQESRRSHRLVQHIDLFATSLDWAGLPADSFARGHSLKAPPEAEISSYSKVDVDGRIGVAIVQDEWKLVVPRTGNLGLRPKLFDRSIDPGETRDIWSERPIIGGYLMTHLRRHEAPSELEVAAEQKEASEELARELEALGYVN